MEKQLYKIVIPYSFAEDRYERDLDMGEGKWSTAGYMTHMTVEQLKELLSDANHYGHGGVDPGTVSKHLINSARKTAERVKFIMEENFIR